MKAEVVAVILQEGGKFVSELIRSLPRRRVEKPEEQPIMAVEESEEITREAPAEEGEVKSSKEGVACIPCVNGHFSVCSGLISDEAIRMARRHGIGDEEISRVNKCLDQLNAMEREDLSVEKIQALPPWEKELAVYAQNESAGIRHKLEGIASIDDLEKAALQIKEARTKIGRDYFRGRLANMPKAQKAELVDKTIEKLETE